MGTKIEEENFNLALTYKHKKGETFY